MGAVICYTRPQLDKGTNQFFFCNEISAIFNKVYNLIIKKIYLIGINCLFQYVTERMGGAEGTRLDNEFMEMERVSFI